MSEPDRYEPLPGIAQLPAWIWRRMGRGARIAAAVAVVATIAIAIPVGLEVRESVQADDRAEERERAERRARLIRTLRREQRPTEGRSDSVAPPGAGDEELLAARAGLFDDLAAAILADSRRRVQQGTLDGPIRRVRCQGFPRTVGGIGAHERLTARRGRYSCVAVTAEFTAGAASEGGVIGHPYRAMVDFESGRWAHCKISSGRTWGASALEQAGFEGEPEVVTPRACGG